MASIVVILPALWQAHVRRRGKGRDVGVGPHRRPGRIDSKRSKTTAHLQVYCKYGIMLQFGTHFLSTGISNGQKQIAPALS